MNTRHWIGLLLVVLVIPSVLIPFFLGLVTDLRDLATQVVAILITILGASGISLLFGDFLFKKEKQAPDKPEIVVEPVKLSSDEIPRELHVRLRRGGEVKHETYFHFVKVRSKRGSVDDLRAYFSINGGGRKPMRIFACPLKETFTVTQTPEIDVVPTEETEEGLEEFAIAFLNDEKWGQDTISLDESSDGYDFLLFFALKGMYRAYVPSNTRRYLPMPSKYRFDLYLEGTGLPLYKAASLDITARSWNLFDVKHLSDVEAQVPKIVVSPAENDSRALKEIRVSLKDGIVPYEARFYFVNIKNLTGPTVNDLEAHFEYGSDHGSILMIWSSGRDHLTLHMEHETIEEFKSRNDALRIALKPGHIYCDRRTVLHQGDLGKTFAIVHTNEGVNGVSTPSLDTRFRMPFSLASEGSQFDLYFSGDKLPYRRFASFRVSANSVTSLKVEPIRVDDDEAGS